MSLKFEISPARCGRSNAEDVLEDVEHLILNPFGQVPKVVFENVIIGSTARRVIVLHNPLKKCMEVGFTKLAPEERGLTFNWYQNEIPPESELELELLWSPKTKGGWRDTIILEDTGKIRKSIAITFKAISPPKKRVVKRKSPPKYLIKRKSPIKKPSPKKFLAPRNRCSPKTLLCVQNNLNMLPTGSRSTEVDRRTFRIDKTPIKTTDNEEPLNDSLEINEPITPTLQTTQVLRDVTNPVVNNIPTIFVHPSANSTVIKTELTYNILNSSFLSSRQGSSESLSGNNATYDIENIKPSSSSPIFGAMWPSTSSKNHRDLHMKIMEETNNFNFSQTPANKSTSLTSVSTSKLRMNGVDERLVKSSSCIKINLQTKYNSPTLTPNVILPILSAVPNPFSNMSVLCDPSWVRIQEKNFKKWLNSLLTPPDELISDCELKVDIGKIWDESSRRVHVPDAPSKETVSIKYHTRAKLDLLRNRAQQLYNSYGILDVITKLCNIVENGKLEIRHDKNLHMDLRLRKGIMSLFFCYNPLWLRIGLETVYGSSIPLKSNSDVYGLCNFIIINFFGDYSSQKYKTMFNEKLSKNLNKFMLKKFLSLVYFLDKAKEKKIIQHDPCLFGKNAPFKESREILVQFAKETISSVGDITKFLRAIGYILSYKQRYIEEYNFAVCDLYGDLKNGVVLARVMEIILLEEGITRHLRVPAISRLQKIHNVKLSFEALSKNNFTISDRIEPSDIVAGEKDKVLSFLWQIINQFQIPRLNKAASIIQVWFRSLPVCIRRRILIKEMQRKESACRTIQLWYRRRLLARKLTLFVDIARLKMIEMKQEKAATMIQAYWKMRSERKRYALVITCVQKLQTHLRRWLIQRRLERKRSAIIMIQANVRRVLARRRFLLLKHAVLIVENYYVAYKSMKNDRENFLTLKRTTIFLQRQYRSVARLRNDRTRFLITRNAVVTIQRWFRSYKLTKSDHQQYLALKEATIVIQRRYRARLAMKNDRANYLRKKHAVQMIQSYYRGYKLMIVERQRFLLLRASAIKLQNMYRGTRAVPKERREFLALRKATICVQQKHRAKKAMLKCRNQFAQFRCCTVRIQRWWRSVLTQKEEIRKRETKAAIKIQATFKGYLTRKHATYELLQIKENLKRANETAKPEKVLGVRLERAIQLLYKSVLQIKVAFLEFEILTRLCKESCETVCATFGHKILLTAGQTIKSLPEQEICSLAIRILINICKHSRELMSRVWFPNDLVSLFDLMIYYSDKDADVFCLLCTLIWLYAHVDEYNDFISSNPQLKQKFERMYQRCLRKYKMTENTNKCTKTYFYPYEKLDLPSVHATWGLDDQKPRHFVNSWHAMISLSKKLRF